MLDFNLFLSKFDVWTATVVATDDGAAMTSTDKSCILPNSLPAVGHAFVNYAYIEDSDDGADQSLDRTREGYVEIIEMATFTSDVDDVDQHHAHERRPAGLRGQQRRPGLVGRTDRHGWPVRRDDD